MNTVQKLDNFHKTRLGYLVFGLVELGLAYWFAILAIDSGSLWQYVLMVIFLIGSLQNFVKIVAVRKHNGRNKQ
jgi:hypothetical protein